MKSLDQILYKNMLRSSLIPLFIIELTLLLLYFTTSQFTTSQYQQTLLKQVTDSVRSTSQREADYINLRLTEVSRLSEILRIDHERFFQTIALCDREVLEPSYAIHPNGVLYKAHNNDGSSLYYAATTPQTRQTLRKTACSEDLTPLLKYTIQSNPLTTQAYFNSWDNMNRTYPFIENGPELFDSNLNVSAFNFYYLADKQHNAERDRLWTDAYLDPAGQGWMISSIVPIYNGDFLEGSVALTSHSKT